MKIFNKIIRKLVIIMMLLGSAGMVSTFQPENTVQADRTAKAKKSKKVKKNKKKSTKLKLDSTKSKKTKKKRLKVKSKIPVTTAYIGIRDPNLHQDVIDAINAWNSTKAVAIVVVNRPGKAYIKITSGYYGNTGWAGETYTNLGGANTPSEIFINTYYTSQVDQRDRRIVIEHELGHALGLNHIDSRPSVMNSVLDINSSGYEIQPEDIAALKALYK